MKEISELEGKFELNEWTPPVLCDKHTAKQARSGKENVKKTAILETLVFAEVHDQLNPLLPVVVIKGMDGMISLIEEFVHDRPFYCS